MIESFGNKEYIYNVGRPSSSILNFFTFDPPRRNPVLVDTSSSSFSVFSVVFVVVAEEEEEEDDKEEDDEEEVGTGALTVSSFPNRKSLSNISIIKPDKSPAAL